MPPKNTRTGSDANSSLQFDAPQFFDFLGNVEAHPSDDGWFGTFSLPKITGKSKNSNQLCPRKSSEFLGKDAQEGEFAEFKKVHSSRQLRRPLWEEADPEIDDNDEVDEADSKRCGSAYTEIYTYIKTNENGESDSEAVEILAHQWL